MRRVLGAIYGFYWGNGIADDVPALTYYLVLSLAPFALGLAAIEAILLRDYISALTVAEELNRFLPDAVHSEVADLVIGTKRNSPLILSASIAAMLWTSSGAIGVLERCLSRILDCPRHNMILGRLRNVGLGAAVAAVIILAAGGASLVTPVRQYFGLAGSAPFWLVPTLNTLGSILLFAAVYRFAPKTRMRWRAALTGALPTGIALQLVPAAVGLYVAATSGAAVARVFSILAVILFGLYTVALLMLVGAGLAARSERRLGGGC